MFTKHGSYCFLRAVAIISARRPMLSTAQGLMMDIFEIVMITLHITHAFTKKYASSSDESIENLLYYKGCQHKAKESTDSPRTPLRAEAPPPPRQPECPFPKMCCSLSCGGDCPNPQSFFNRQMDAMSNIQPIQPIQPSPMRQSQAPIQPQVIQRGRKKKGKFPPGMQMQMPIPSRRNFGFTKDKIKSLISQDEDIRKILKDLVRVTIKKVDLLDMMTPGNVETVTNAEVPNNSDEYEYD